MTEYVVTAYDIDKIELPPGPPEKGERVFPLRWFKYENGLNPDGSCRGEWIDCTLPQFRGPYSGDARVLITSHAHDGLHMYTISAATALIQFAEEWAEKWGGEWQVWDRITLTEPRKADGLGFPAMEESLALVMRQTAHEKDRPGEPERPSGADDKQ